VSVLVNVTDVVSCETLVPSGLESTPLMVSAVSINTEHPEHAPEMPISKVEPLVGMLPVTIRSLQMPFQSVNAIGSGGSQHTVSTVGLHADAMT